MSGVTEDTVYQGRVTLFQPEKGFRAGTDSLLLAAALPNRPGGEAIEFGCGCGGALFTAACRLPDMRFIGVDMDIPMIELAQRGVAANGLGDRVSVHAAFAQDWVHREENRFDLVFANPPYFEPGRISDPGEGKAGAYLETAPLRSWLTSMHHTAKPRAPIILIHRAAELARILSILDNKVGELTVLPVASKAGEDARRVLIRGRKGLKRGPTRLMAPLVLHAADGSPSPALEAIRRGEAIDW